jgi:ubiquinone biosynthesis protein UbiJ
LLTEFTNTLANASLQLDPLSESRLRDLDGRCAHLVTKIPAPVYEKTFTLLVSDGRIEFLPYAVPEPNAIVRGSIPDLLTWLVKGPAGSARINVEGDESVLGELSGIFHAFTPDLSGPISQLVGVEVAAEVLNIAEGAMATLRSAMQGVGSTLQSSTTDHYVTRSSLSAFLDVLQDTQARVDRLAQRVRAEESHRSIEPGAARR